MSGNQALAALREQGISPRRQSFFNEWRSVAGYEKNKFNARFQPESKAPSEAYVTPTERYIHSPYTYRFEADLYDPRTGEYKRGFLHQIGDELITIGEARAKLEAGIVGRKGAKCEAARLGKFVGAFERVWTPPMA